MACPFVCRRTKLPGRDAHNEKISESGRRRVREDVVTTNLEKDTQS